MNAKAKQLEKLRARSFVVCLDAVFAFPLLRSACAICRCIQTLQPVACLAVRVFQRRTDPAVRQAAAGRGVVYKRAVAQGPGHHGRLWAAAVQRQCCCPSRCLSCHSSRGPAVTRGPACARRRRRTRPSSAPLCEAGPSAKKPTRVHVACVAYPLNPRGVLCLK